MIRFLDGPAADLALALRRAPVLLRVVRTPRGGWDALDQLDDVPAPREAIFVYRRVSAVTRYHLLVRGKGKRASGFYARADYRYVPEQPADADARDTAAWRAWCQAVQAREPGGGAEPVEGGDQAQREAQRGKAVVIGQDSAESGSIGENRAESAGSGNITSLSRAGCSPRSDGWAGRDSNPQPSA